MAGRLEANPEEELKKELVKPEFMSKPATEWNEEEQKAAKEFEKKEQKVLLLHLFYPCNQGEGLSVVAPYPIRANTK